MVAVAIAALDFGAIRAFLGHRANVVDERRGFLLLLGALPMANVLALGILIGQRRSGSRPFLLGFEALGSIALAFFIALAWCFHREVVSSYLSPVFALIETTIGVSRPHVTIPIGCLVTVLMLGGPQAALALAGGFISCRIKINISPR
jgi:hypothetical protein